MFILWTSALCSKSLWPIVLGHVKNGAGGWFCGCGYKQEEMILWLKIIVTSRVSLGFILFYFSCWIPRILYQHQSSNTSVLFLPYFLIVQLSYPYRMMEMPLIYTYRYISVWRSFIGFLPSSSNGQSVLCLLTDRSFVVNSYFLMQMRKILNKEHPYYPYYVQQKQVFSYPLPYKLLLIHNVAI